LALSPLKASALPSAALQNESIPTGDGTFDTTERYIYDGDNIALVLNGSGNIIRERLTNRIFLAAAIGTTMPG